MTPVRVEFTLRTPMVISPTDKTFDAVLSWAAVRRADLLGAPDPLSTQHAIGLAVHQTENGWCHMASKLAIEWVGEQDNLHYIKRQNLGDYTDAWLKGALKKKPAIDTSRGDTKAGSYVQQIRWVKRIQAWAIVEDMKHLQALLPWVTHVGKLHHRDMGAVSSWAIHEDATASQKWTERPLPLGSPHAGVAHVPVMGGLHSPYWKREDHCIVLTPCL